MTVLLFDVVWENGGYGGYRRIGASDKSLSESRLVKTCRPIAARRNHLKSYKLTSRHYILNERIFPDAFKFWLHLPNERIALTALHSLSARDIIVPTLPYQQSGKTTITSTK